MLIRLFPVKFNLEYYSELNESNIPDSVETYQTENLLVFIGSAFSNAEISVFGSGVEITIWQGLHRWVINEIEYLERDV